MVPCNSSPHNAQNATHKQPTCTTTNNQNMNKGGKITLIVLGVLLVVFLIVSGGFIGSREGEGVQAKLTQAKLDVKGYASKAKARLSSSKKDGDKPASSKAAGDVKHDDKKEEEEKKKAEEAKLKKEEEKKKKKEEDDKKKAT